MSGAILTITMPSISTQTPAPGSSLITSRPSLSFFVLILFSCSSHPSPFHSPDSPLGFELTEAQIRKLHIRCSKDCYRDWRDMAPAHWVHDTWFSTRSLAAISSRYGQNTELDFDNDHHRLEFRQQRNIRKMRWLSFALATQIESVLFLLSPLPFSYHFVSSLFFRFFFQSTRTSLHPHQSRRYQASASLPLQNS